MQLEEKIKRDLSVNEYTIFVREILSLYLKLLLYKS